VYFPRELTDSGDGELTWTEIVGFTIADSISGQTVGEVTGVDLSTINTLFEVRTPDGQTLLIPANDELIDDINRQERCITMRIPEGLMEL
jgi:16S rRNA processing protein RimM